MKSSRRTVSIARRSRSERSSPRRSSSPILASRSRRRSSSLLTGRLGSGMSHPSLIGPSDPGGSASDVKQPDRPIFALVPDPENLRGGQQHDLAPFPGEEVGRLGREPHPAVLPGADDQAVCPRCLPVDVLGLLERDRVRRPVDRLGELLLALAYLAVRADEDVVVEDRPFDGDRAEVRCVDPGLHLTPPICQQASMRDSRCLGQTAARAFARSSTPSTSLTPPKVVYASSMFAPASAILRATCAMVPGRSSTSTTITSRSSLTSSPAFWSALRVAVTSSTRMCTVALPPPVARQQNPSMLTPAPAVASPSLASSPGRSSKTTLKSLAIACLAFEFAPPAPEDITRAPVDVNAPGRRGGPGQRVIIAAPDPSREFASPRRRRVWSR